MQGKAMEPVESYIFRYCTIEVWPHRVDTVFPDGLVLSAAPEDLLAVDRERAGFLGYPQDDSGLFYYCRDRALIYQLLAEAQHYPYSYPQYQQAQGAGVNSDTEALVLAVMVWLRMESWCWLQVPHLPLLYRLGVNIFRLRHRCLWYLHGESWCKTNAAGVSHIANPLFEVLDHLWGGPRDVNIEGKLAAFDDECCKGAGDAGKE